MVFLTAGCGGTPAPAELARTAKKPATPAPEVVISTKRPAEFMSVFSTENPRDPFNPQAKPKKAAAQTPQQAVVEKEADERSIQMALQAGFKGIYGTATEREVVIYGAFLREKSTATITVPVNGQPRVLKIRAVKISRTVAELQVDGLPQPIAVTRAQGQ